MSGSRSRQVGGKPPPRAKVEPDAPAPTSIPEAMKAAGIGAPPNSGIQPPANANGVEFVKKTLKVLGPNLPVGITAPDGSVSRLFRLRPYRLKEQKALGAIRAKAKAMQIGQFVTEILLMMVQTIGPYSFDDPALPEPQRRTIIGGLTLADVLYLYVYLRYEAFNHEAVDLRITCANCSHTFDFSTDLEGLDVLTAPDNERDMRWSYKLEEPLSLSGRTCNELWLRPLPWSAFEGPDFAGLSKDPGGRDAAMLRHTIVGGDGIDFAPFLVDDSELEDGLSLFDAEGLKAEIDERSPGPQLIIEVACPRCRTELVHPIDWGYDSFFRRSSRRSRGST